jgi:hypothetical protein
MTMVSPSVCLDLPRAKRSQHLDMAWRPLLSALAIGSLLALAGCGKGSAPSVHGKVTLDGESVTQGSISFFPEAVKGPRAAAAIEQGVYALAPHEKLTPGKYRVEISWRKPTGKKIPSADPGIMIDETREAVPTKFNSDSTLIAEIAHGETEKDFDLTSK